MQHTRGFAVLLGGATLAAIVGCAPDDGVCEADIDCPFGQMCFEGTCGIAGGSSGGGSGGGGGGGMFGDGGGSTQSITGNVSAALDGVIGGTEVRSTRGTVTVDFGRVTLLVPDDRFASTFLIVSALPASALAVPGRQTIWADGLDGSYSQACNYDTGAGYDEFFSGFVIDVGAPRDPVDGETGTNGGGSIEVLTPGPVIDVSITVAGEGSNVTGSAVVPTALLGL